VYAVSSNKKQQLSLKPSLLPSPYRSLPTDDLLHCCAVTLSVSQQVSFIILYCQFHNEKKNTYAKGAQTHLKGSNECKQKEANAPGNNELFTHISVK
jgi:hypothetical protein